ncbi:hypothetical protein BDP27DRAFT_1368471 [Rhodocollybia butyracea]|uniref:Uncharacterized protein n=1 Tax=Rhodocollybia butyracea TaxID=206335 RepID=A0A9P5PD26_9AGAR|nr:hypothetical protein BDP27DRAFT_1368471 [Rhodocollybia butyracea]
MSNLTEKEASSCRHTVPSSRLTDAANADPNQVLPSQKAAVQHAQAEKAEKEWLLLAEGQSEKGTEELSTSVSACKHKTPPADDTASDNPKSKAASPRDISRTESNKDISAKKLTQSKKARVEPVPEEDTQLAYPMTTITQSQSRKSPVQVTQSTSTL